MYHLTVLQRTPISTWRKESSESLHDISDILHWDGTVNSLFVMNSNNINEISDPNCKGFKGIEDGLAGDNATKSEGKCVTTKSVINQ